VKISSPSSSLHQPKSAFLPIKKRTRAWVGKGRSLTTLTAPPGRDLIGQQEENWKCK
jgi:hypothetical protein